MTKEVNKNQHRPLDGSFRPEASMDPSECSRDSTDEPTEPIEHDTHATGPEMISPQLLDPLLRPSPARAAASTAVNRPPPRQGQPAPAPPDVHLVIAGVAKRPNVVALLQLAVAFGVKKVLVVGQEKNLGDLSAMPAVLQQLLLPPPPPPSSNVEEEDGTRTQPHLSMIRFRKWPNLVEYLREHDIPLVGVEIHPNALSVPELLEKYVGGRRDGGDSTAQLGSALDDQAPPPSRGGGGSSSSSSFALVMGNEGDGLSPAQMDACHDFVRIPQYGTGTASLNVAVAASIVLHQYHTYRMAVWGEDGARAGDLETCASGDDQP